MLILFVVRLNKDFFGVGLQIFNSELCEHQPGNMGNYLPEIDS